VTAAPARASRVPFAERRPLIFALGVAAVVLALTTDERVFGLLTDGQVMTRTAYSMAALREEYFSISSAGIPTISRTGRLPGLVSVSA